MHMDSEKFDYLTSGFEFFIEGLVDGVLADSPTDPEKSAVYAANMIKCYIEFMAACGKPLPYTNIEEFFDYIKYPKEEYILFEESRRKESEYYRGVQY